LKEKAIELNAEVHMPRMGTGYAGGSWGLIEQLVDEILCRAGISVTVYELPATQSQPFQKGLFD
jgi:hypothetical protein